MRFLSLWWRFDARSLVLAGLACCSSMGCTLAWAQASDVTSSISGKVQDTIGAVVSGALVQASAVDTGFTRTANTAPDGTFTLPLLTVGRYNLLVTATGFERFVQKAVEAPLGYGTPVTVTLQPGADSQTVTVNADASILNTETFDLSDGLNQRSVENMPITSRNTFNLALLVPGLNGTRDDEFGNPTFAFGGLQRKAFLIDGIDNTQRGGPGRLGIFSPEDVKEIRVISGAMDAQYGRTVGGIINFVTRGGTNEIHGEGLVLERRPGLISKPSLAVGPKPFQQWATFSVNLGGPIIHDKLFYFISGEYGPEDGARPITITPANAAALGLPASELGSAPFKQRFQSYLGRLDFQWNPQNDFYLRASAYQTPSQFNTSGGLQTISSSNNFNDKDQTGAAQWSRIVSPRALNELRAGYLRRIFDRPPVSGVVGPVINISGVATLGSNTAAGQRYEEDQYNGIDDFSYSIGAHQLRFGTDIDTIHVLSQDRLTLTFSFANLATYLGTLSGAINPATQKPYNYTSLTEAFGSNTAEHRTTPINFHTQDHWRVSDRLSLNYGLRWEGRIYPTLNQNAPLAISRTLPDDYEDFAPRLGFTYRAAPATVVRGGYGINYDTPNLRLISLVDRSNGQQVQTFTVSGTATGAPQYPSAFTGPANQFAVKTTVSGFHPNFKTQSAQQMDLALEQQVGTNYSVTVGTQLYLGRRAPVLFDTNLGPVASLSPVDGRPIFSSTRPNAAYGPIYALSSEGSDTYYGGFVQLKKRLSHSFQFDTSYTVGWALNNNDSVGDNGNNVTNSTNLNADYGWSSSDQRHRFVLQGVYQPRFELEGPLRAIVNGFNFATNATVTSGFPYSALAGSDLNNDGVTNDYTYFASRNTFRGPKFREWNLRGSRVFSLYRERVSLEIIAEAENLLNSTNAACNAGGCAGGREQHLRRDHRDDAAGRAWSADEQHVRHAGRRVQLTASSVGRPLTLLVRGVIALLGLGFACVCQAQTAASPVAAVTAPVNHKLLVISVDGFDWRYLRDRDAMGERIPNLRKLLAAGQVADGVTGVWPTITWPSHTTLLTGVRPDQHGILGNRRPRSDGGDYYWSAHLLRVPSLLNCAAEHGLTTAAVTWPVTVEAPLTYNLPEYFVRRNGGSMDMESVASRATPPDLVTQIARDMPSFPQQWMDDRTRTQAVVWLLQHKQPDLVLVHLVDLDSDQHDLGPFNATSRATLERTDELIGEMMAALPAGYDLVVTADHGFERVDQIANLNVLLAQHGITGQVELMGGIATTKDPAVAEFLRSESAGAKDSIGRVIPNSELQKHAPGLASSLLAVEPAEHTKFGYGAPGNDRPGSARRETPAYLSAPAEKGNHGFWPARHDYGSVYVLYGPGVTHQDLGRIEMTSIKDRMAAVLRLSCP